MTTVSMLQDMIDQCRQLKALLMDDKEQFIANNLEAVNANNERKSAHLEQLVTLINTFTQPQASMEQSLIETISAQTESLEPEQKFEIKNLLTELKAEVAQCYEKLIVNSQLVFTNLNQLKEMWDKVMASKTQLEDVYDHKGLTSK